MRTLSELKRGMVQLARVDTDRDLLTGDPFRGMPPLGELIGRGYQRWVYAHRDDPQQVVKILRPERMHNNCNRAEWRNWARIRQTGYAPHFAPCVDIGPAWLTMRRCEPLGDAVVATVPDICRYDANRPNFGILDGRVVCLDYGNMLVQDISDTVAFIEFAG